MEVCPADIILAPAERIWHLLADPRELARWSGTRLIEGPARELRAGDHFVLRKGTVDITADILNAQAPRRLALDTALPFGISNHEQFQITPIDANSCRVTLNCDFTLPPGWRGRLVEMVLGRRLVTGPARSLRRLKRAAEQPAPS